MLYSLFTILPFTACLFWTAVLLLDWHRDNPAQHVLAAFMAASAALYMCHAAFFNHEFSAVSECVYAFCNVSVFPLYYLYICRLTESDGLSAKHLAMLLPTLAIGLWAIVLNVFWPSDIEAERVRIIAMRIVFMVQLVPICWICYRRLKAFDSAIANYYADTDDRSVRPTERMMWLLIGGALISGAANFLGREYFDESGLTIIVPSLLFTVLLFGVGYVGKRQEFCIDDMLRDEQSDERQSHADTVGADKALCPAGAPGDEETSNFNATDNATTASDKSIEKNEGVHDSGAVDEPSTVIARLSALMAEKQSYLRPDLRLSEVAETLGVGRTTLSQRINQELHLSFSDYINNLRIDHACRLLDSAEGKRMSLSGVAELSGFSSDSSFYRAFRRHTGLTPKQYMEK